MKVVLDTNVIVSGLLSGSGWPGKIVDFVVSGEIKVAYDTRIIYEYEDVLGRSKFGFSPEDYEVLIDVIINVGLPLVAAPLNVNLPDGDDLMFLEVAKEVGAVLVTGNLKHFPVKLRRGVEALSPQEFGKKFFSS